MTSTDNTGTIDRNTFYNKEIQRDTEARLKTKSQINSSLHSMHICNSFDWQEKNVSNLVKETSRPKPSAYAQPSQTHNIFSNTIQSRPDNQTK